MQTIEVLTAENFRTWLENVEPDTVVGKSCSIHDCPIYHFLNSQKVGVNRVPSC